MLRIFSAHFLSLLAVAFFCSSVGLCQEPAGLEVSGLETQAEIASSDSASELATTVLQGADPQDTVAENSGAVGENSHDAQHAGEHHGSGHRHDFDPTHSNLSDLAEDPSEWRSDMAIASLIIFGCLLAGLLVVAWRPIAEGLEKREKSIANSIANAERASRESMEKLKEYEAKLAAAATEAQQIVADARKDAEAAGQRLIEAAQAEANSQKQRSLAEIESAKAVALNELTERSTDLALTLAGRMVGREVKPDDHQNMIQEMLSKIPSRN